MNWLGDVSLVAPATLIVADVVAGLLVLFLLTRPRTRKHWWRHVVTGLILGSVIGGTAIWVVGDVLNAFDVSPTWVDRIATGAMVAGVVLAVVNLVGTTVGRRVVAVVGALAVVVAGALTINLDVGEYLTIGQLAGEADMQPLTLPAARPGAGTGTGTGTGPGEGDHAGDAGDVRDATLWRTWRAPSDQPSVGRVGAIDIPGTKSGFRARDAVVYLSPAALVADPPALPVLVMMSGQPAAPSSVMVSGKLQQTLDAFAAKHDGLAPIVVVPDQLGAAPNNPMCVDGPLGNSATYLTEDVPAWIMSHLHVQTSRLSWGVGGFSQGGTCSLQFAATNSDLFGSFIDVSGQLGPVLRTRESSIERGFGGDAAAYDRAQPLAVMAAHGRYSDTVGVVAAGENDRRYSGIADQVTRATRAAGMTIDRYESEGSGHDWTTASRAFAYGIDHLAPRLGLEKGGTS